jgi:hypothetical protein
MIDAFKEADVIIPEISKIVKLTKKDVKELALAMFNKSVPDAVRKTEVGQPYAPMLGLTNVNPGQKKEFTGLSDEAKIKMSKQPATTGQLNYLKSLGYDGKTPENSLEAHTLISDFKKMQQEEYL